MKNELEDRIICLAWATKKRHIAVNGKVLCETKSKTAGYSVKNGCYNTIALSGDEQQLIINTKTICKKFFRILFQLYKLEF
jgi:hypothetical protein